MSDKLEAHFLLSDSPTGQLAHWERILRGWNSLQNAANDDQLAERGADAVLAAVADNDSYERAEALYIETSIGPLRKVLAACAEGAGDPFIGKHYLTGSGSVNQFKERLKRMFFKSVQEIRLYKSQLAHE